MMLNKLKIIPEELLLNLLSVVAILNIAGWYWDGWWHITLGRDSFWSPPHILLYAYIFVFFFCSLVLYKKSGEKIYKYILITEGITLFAGLVDILWHTVFGVEKLISPLIVWSPPHLLAFSATLVGMLFLLNDWIKKYTKNPSSPLAFLRIALLSGASFGLLRIIISPFEPLILHNVIGFPGAGIATLFSAFYLLYLAYNMPKSGIVIFTTVLFIALIVFEATTVAPNQVLPLHATPPHWLHYFAIVMGVAWIDFIDVRKYHPALLGGISGFFLYLIYVLFWRFIQSPHYDYDWYSGTIMILASTIGGIVAGFLFNFYLKRIARGIEVSYEAVFKEQ